jgi:hypothetical protein
LVLGETREVLLFVGLQLLDVLDLFDQQQHQQTDDLFVDSLLDGDSAVFLQPHRGDVFEGFNAGGVDVVEEADEVHFLFVAVESEHYLDFVLVFSEAVLLQEHDDVFASDEAFASRDVVEEGEGMEVGASGDGFAVGLQHVLLLFEKQEVVADVAEDFGLFEFWPFGAVLKLH